MARLRLAFASLATLEGLTVTCWLTGWLLLTWGSAWATGAAWLWPLSLGLLVLGVGGVRPACLVLWIGVRGWVALGRQESAA